MSLSDKREGGPGGPPQREPNSRGEPVIEKEDVSAVVSAGSKQAGRTPGKDHRRAYRISVIGTIPANLAHSVSLIHASALRRDGPGGEHVGPERKSSKGSMEQGAAATRRREDDMRMRRRMNQAHEQRELT